MPLLRSTKWKSKTYTRIVVIGTLTNVYTPYICSILTGITKIITAIIISITVKYIRISFLNSEIQKKKNNSEEISRKI